MQSHKVVSIMEFSTEMGNVSRTKICVRVKLGIDEIFIKCPDMKPLNIFGIII